MKLNALLTLFVTIFSISVFANDEENDFPIHVTDECKSFVSKIRLSGFSYGWIKSLENPKDPNSKVLEVFYYTKLKAHQEPIIFYYGGPLGLDHSSYTDLPALLEGSNSTFIFMDQRGTGCSSPVPTEKTFEGLQRASNYGTEGIVEDSEILRKHLLGPDRKWKVFGQSFGGTIVNRYIIKYPQSISKAYSFGGHFLNNFVEFYQQRLKAQALVLQAFAKARPAAYQKFLTARELVTDADCIITNGQQKVCGKVLFDVYFLLLRGENRYDRMEAQFSEVLTSDGKINLDSIKKNAEYSFDYFFSAKYIAAQALIRQEILTEPLDKRQLCKQGLLNLHKEGFDVSLIILSECRIINLTYQPELLKLFETSFPLIPANPIDPDQIISALNQNPNLPFYVYAAGLDAFSPEESLNSYQYKSPQIIYRFLPQADHWGFYYSEEFKKDLIN